MSTAAILYLTCILNKTIFFNFNYDYGIFVISFQQSPKDISLRYHAIILLAMSVFEHKLDYFFIWYNSKFKDKGL
jgi:hypothetical protein